MRKRANDFLSVGLAVSFGGHAVFLYIVLVGFSGFKAAERPRVVYSVSIEGGATRGGISQVPKKTKGKADLAPPKKVKKPLPKPKSKAKEKVKVETKKKVEPKVEKKVEKIKPKPQEEPKPAKKKVLPKPKKDPQKKKAEPPKRDVNKDFQEAMQRYLGESTDAGGSGFGGDGTTGEGMGGGQQRSPEWFAYKDELEYHIKAGWNWHDNTSDLLASVSFEISPAGVVSKVAVVESSGNSQFDESVVRAVWRASPVPKAPTHLYNDFSFVEMTFIPE